MTEEPVPCEKLSWDTDFFGFGVGKVTATTISTDVLTTVDEFCREESIQVVFYLADSNNVQDIHAAEDNGYRLVDDRIKMDRDLDTVPEADLPSNITLRPHNQEDIDKLKQIARSVFKYDRFHMDPNFSDEQCDEMRATWTENMCGDLGDRVIVAEVNDSIGGYIALELDNTVGKIVLTGIAPEVQGEGLGTTLTAEALRWFQKEGCRSAVVVTQGRNIPGQRIYQKMGFRTADSNFWLHKWFNRSREQTQ